MIGFNPKSLMLQGLLILALGLGCRSIQPDNLRHAAGGSSAQVSNDREPSTEDGKGLYLQNCAGCHGPLENSDKRGVAAELIKHGIATIKEMRHLAILSDIDIKAIASALNDDRLVCRSSGDPGPAPLRRLNRREYSNTLRSLLGLNYDAGDDLAIDVLGATFSNIASVQNLTDNHVDLYFTAAEKAIKTFLASSPENKKRYFVCDPGQGTAKKACFQTILEKFASAAFRRPLAPEELPPYVATVEKLSAAGLSNNEALGIAMQAILLSPSFLFLIETDQTTTLGNNVVELSDYELASRLSYFLWGTMPDDILMEAARNKQLKATLADQVNRMLSDERGRYVVQTFVSEWLQFYRLDGKSPSEELFPNFDPKLLGLMKEETVRFFEYFAKSDANMMDIYTTPLTFVNQTLASHYGLSGTVSGAWQKVDLAADSKRLGLLTQGSVLAASSGSGPTSPVQRGNWLVKQLLCTVVPDPPPGVPSLEKSSSTGSLKERLEGHRNNPACASCHKVMDGPGFALEEFNAVGQHRTLYEDGLMVDAEGLLASGQIVNGAAAMAEQVRANPEAEVCLVRHALTFATGNEQKAADSCAVDDITAQAKAAGFSFEGIVRAIVLSPKFSQRLCD